MAVQRSFPTLVMDANSHVSLKDQKGKQFLLVEVANVEKQLWALIHTKGLLHSDVQDLNRKVCSSYEKILLNDHPLAELQDVEYSLWKLHYRHIDEFRKRIKKISTNEETTKFMALQSVAAQRSNDNHIEGFKSFLSEATEFYQDMIIKIRRCYVLPEVFSFHRSSTAVSVEPKKMQKLQFLCYRFQVCLGDLARYREQCEKSDIQNHNWSVAVAHYLEATMIWPDSGSAQNQLAVLAMYVGDEFLALYHCIRSIAVKEPFPDAWNNLSLLFERNRSTHLHSLSSEAGFNFLKPSECRFRTKSESTDGSSNCKMVKAEQEGLMETNLWPLIIRMISFFFEKSSMEDFPITFASTMKELDVMMALEDANLKAAMESYQRMGSARRGPFRTLQVASIFIFVIENLINSPEAKDSKTKNDTEPLIQMALTATFIVMGRLVDRCLKANLLDCCPLLPAVLVFVEWLVTILDNAETYASHDRTTSSMSYFFGAFNELLKSFHTNKDQVKLPAGIALWEDYELRGFAPLARSHVLLDFSTHWEHADSFVSGTKCRTHRIVNAAMKIAERSNNRNWIFYDKSGRKFYVVESAKFPGRKESEKAESTGNDLEVSEPLCDAHRDTVECEKVIHGEKPSSPRVLGKSMLEEEEVILFKPLTRYNSAPLHGSIKSDDQMPSEDAWEQIVPADECLRRATSLLIAQNSAQGDHSTFHSDLTNFRCNKPSKNPEPVIKDTVSHPFSEVALSSGPSSVSTSINAGPPSLSAWVLNRGSLVNDRMKGKNDLNKHSLASIEEIVSTSLNDLSISETQVSSSHESISSHCSSPIYSAPVPSAPFLPDDAVWFNDVQFSLSDFNNSGNGNKINNFFDPAQVSGYSNWTGSHQLLDYGPSVPGFADGFPPSRRMTSSEWLRQYRENQNVERASHIWPIHSYAAGNTGKKLGNDIPRSGLLDQWGTPLASNPLICTENPTLHPGFPPVYGTDEPRREKLYHGYQRTTPYGCSAVNEPQPLLQILKEKEWLLQQHPTLRGPTYMGS